MTSTPTGRPRPGASSRPCTSTPTTTPTTPQLAELVGELSVRDPDFRRWWADHDVLRRTHGTKTYHHPIAGTLTLDYEALNPTGDPDLTLGIYTAEPNSRSAHALQLLAP